MGESNPFGSRKRQDTPTGSRPGFRPSALTGTTTYQPASYIPGVKHTVEGQNASYETWSRPYDSTMGSRGDGGHEQYNQDRRDVYAKNVKAKTAYDQAIEGFKRKQKLRLSIPSLPDSEAVNLEGQKGASRARMRGRVGSMLSQRETLG